MPLSLKVAVITHPISNLLICLALILKNVFKRNIKSLWYDPHTPESWSDEFLLMLLNYWPFDGYCMWHKLLSSTKFSKFYIKHFRKIISSGNWTLNIILLCWFSSEPLSRTATLQLQATLISNYFDKGLEFWKS